MNIKEIECTRVPLFELVKSWDSKTQTFIQDKDKSNRTEPTFAPGAIDGIYIKHGGFRDDEKGPTAEEIVDFLLPRYKNHDLATVDEFDTFLNKSLMLVRVGAVLKALPGLKVQKAPIASLARLLIKNSRAYSSVKLGISLLGISGEEDDLPLILEIGRYPEFTYFSANAIGRLSKNKLKDWMVLAESTEDWGKVHTIERICNYLEKSQNKDRDNSIWLLKNCTGHSIAEYTAYVSACACNLLELLKDEKLEDDVLDNACSLFLCLITEKPVKSIEDWEHGPETLPLLLETLLKRELTSYRLFSVTRILYWLEDRKSESYKAPEKNYWCQENIESLRILCNCYLEEPKAKSIVSRDFTESIITEDSTSGFYAWNASMRLDLDLWDEAYKALSANPCRPRWYGFALDTEVPERIEKVFAYAEQHLPLHEAEEDETVSSLLDSDLLQCLDNLISPMAFSELYNDRLVRACIKSKRRRLVNMAVRTLKSNVENASSETQIALKAISPDFLRAESRKELEDLIAKFDSIST